MSYREQTWKVHVQGPPICVSDINTEKLISFQFSSVRGKLKLFLPIYTLFSLANFLKLKILYFISQRNFAHDVWRPHILLSSVTKQKFRNFLVFSMRQRGAKKKVEEINHRPRVLSKKKKRARREWRKKQQQSRREREISVHKKRENAFPFLHTHSLFGSFGGRKVKNCAEHSRARERARGKFLLNVGKKRLLKACLGLENFPPHTTHSVIPSCRSRSAAARASLGW